METLTKPFALRVPAGKIVVDGARTLRLHITGAQGSVLWFAGSDDGELEPFEAEGDAFWGPTTNGSTIYFVATSGGENIAVTKIAVGRNEIAPNSTACLQDVACARDAESPEVEQAGRAVALIRFVRGDASYVCTGGLVNDSANSRTPYFLTARHCIGTQDEADSIEAVWNLRAESCGSTTPARPVARTYGADLLVASAATDVALLRLRKLPPDRVFLGIDTAPLATGTPTYRLSHAEASTQKYSAGEVHASAESCATAPRPNFVYTKPTAGAIAVGSSGAPLLLPGLRIAGQLYGRCGPSPNDACAIYNDAVDGSIGASWPLLAPYLDPPPRRRAVRH